MRERQSRRRFLGAGLGCAAPILLRTPLLAAAGQLVGAGPGGRPDEALLLQLQEELARTYRRARSAVQSTGRVPGEQLRALSSNVGLLQAYLAGRGDDARFDAGLRERVSRDGRDATAIRLCDAYRSFAETAGAECGVPLPAEPGFARAALALDLLETKGIRRTTRLLRQWAERQANRADRTAGSFAAPLLVHQKPGDDFGGYDDSEGESEYSCDDMTILVDMIAVAAAFSALTGDEAVAVALGIVLAVLVLARDLACRPTAT